MMQLNYKTVLRIGTIADTMYQSQMDLLSMQY